MVEADAIVMTTSIKYERAECVVSKVWQSEVRCSNGINLQADSVEVWVKTYTLEV